MKYRLDCHCKTKQLLLYVIKFCRKESKSDVLDASLVSVQDTLCGYVGKCEYERNDINCLCIMEYLRQINHNNLITGENTDFPKSDIQKERYFILIIKYPIKDAACELKNFN